MIGSFFRGRGDGETACAVDFVESEREELGSITRSRSMPQALATRARIVLLSADSESNTDIAERLGLSKPTVGIWRKRYLTQRITGLYDEPRPGGSRSVRDEQVAALLRKTLKTKPKDGTHWSCRSIAAETKLSKSTVQRIWKALGLQPHRQKHFKISTDALFVEKVRDIVGLYLNPPDHAVVLCVDEKTQIQALDRTAPFLPPSNPEQPLREDQQRKGHPSPDAPTFRKRSTSRAGSALVALRSPPANAGWPGPAETSVLQVSRSLNSSGVWARRAGTPR